MSLPAWAEYRSLIRVALLLLLALTVTACSAVRLVYPNLDRMVVWRTTDYVDLNRAQRSWLRREAQVFLHWHRTEQLSHWAELLREFDRSVYNGVDAEQLDDFQLRVNALIDAMLEQMMPAVTELMAQLSEKQIQGFAAAMAKSNEDLNEDYVGLDPDEQREVWRNKVRDGLDRWIGRFTPEQNVMLEFVSQEVTPNNTAWVEYRQLWQGDLLAALSTRDDRQALETRVLELVMHRERWHTDDYSEISRRNQVAYERFAVELLTSLDERQQRQLSSRLASLADDFTALAATTRAAPQSPGPAPPG